MKIISINIGSTNIEFYNSMWTGYESIYANGVLVSKKFSWFGTDHIFEVEEAGEWVEYVLTSGLNGMGVSTDLRRNGIPIIESGNTGRHVTIPVPTNRKYSLEELV